MYTQMKENARVERNPSTLAVGYLVDGDVVDSCFYVTQGTWRPK